MSRGEHKVSIPPDRPCRQSLGELPPAMLPECDHHDGRHDERPSTTFSLWLGELMRPSLEGVPNREETDVQIHV